MHFTYFHSKLPTFGRLTCRQIADERIRGPHSDSNIHQTIFPAGTRTGGTIANPRTKNSPELPFWSWWTSSGPKCTGKKRNPFRLQLQSRSV
ncbi:hypothetical protein CDAR_289101 [Caerostris darwini]|uniref:Uncharacterized protein n=1 Tax=Caerostris darwini TaxID=1538125 RepID=A0AAV4PF51_9ARAC|nr:hypothetical protein CDAR_289101 [Caerostris darwini]